MIFKLHYGLWFSGLVGIIPFSLLYALQYTNLSVTHYGILYSILPFVALLAKPIVCSYADSYAVHHHALLLFIFLTILGYGSLAVYPLIPNFVNDHKEVMWIFYSIGVFIGNTSMCVVNSIGDTLAINSCQRKNQSYGDYRMWGPVGFGIFGAIWGISNQIPSLPPYIPGILMMVTLLIIDTIILACWYDKEEFRIFTKHHIGSQTNQLPTYESINATTHLPQTGDEPSVPAKIPLSSNLKYIKKLCLEHKSIFVYLFLFTFCGIMTALHWQFFFVYVQDQAKAKHERFDLIAGLALPVQSLGGELVFFFLSNRIMKFLGPALTLMACLISFGLRYLAYAYFIPVVNIYWILVVELLQGPAFGLMYSVLACQAKHYADCIDGYLAQNALSSRDPQNLHKSLHATLQGALGASFEGLGLCLGGIIGALAYDIDKLLLWRIGGFSSVSLAVIYLFSYLIKRLLFKSNSLR